MPSRKSSPDQRLDVPVVGQGIGAPLATATDLNCSNIQRISPCAFDFPSAPPGCLRWGRHRSFALTAPVRAGVVHLRMRADIGARRAAPMPGRHIQTKVPALQGCRRVKERCPRGRGSMAGHWESDSRYDRSVRCWSGSHSGCRCDRCDGPERGGPTAVPRRCCSGPDPEARAGGPPPRAARACGRGSDTGSADRGSTSPRGASPTPWCHRRTSCAARRA